MALSLKTALAIHAWVATSCAQSSAGPAPSMSVSYSTNAGVTLGMDGVTMATGMPSLVSVCPDKSSTRTFVVDADRAGATFSATSPVGSFTLKYSGAGPALAGLDMTLSFTSNASAMAKPQDLWFLPLASGGWCYHTQQDGKWAPDTTGPWSFPHYGEDTPGGSLDLGYPLPGGRGTPGLMPGPQVHFAEWAESSIVSVLPAIRPTRHGAGSRGVRTSGAQCWCSQPLSQEKLARSSSRCAPAREIRAAFLPPVWHRMRTRTSASCTHCNTSGPIAARLRW